MVAFIIRMRIGCHWMPVKKSECFDLPYTLWPRGNHFPGGKQRKIEIIYVQLIPIEPNKIIDDVTYLGLCIYFCTYIFLYAWKNVYRWMIWIPENDDVMFYEFFTTVSYYSIELKLKGYLLIQKWFMISIKVCNYNHGEGVALWNDGINKDY